MIVIVIHKAIVMITIQGATFSNFNIGITLMVRNKIILRKIILGL